MSEGYYNIVTTLQPCHKSCYNLVIFTWVIYGWLTYINIIQFNNTIITIFIVTLDPPVIDEGSFVPRPSDITDGNKRVKIGTPVYVNEGFDVIIDCNTANGTPPITITWFRDGSPYLSGENISTITITDPRNGEVFVCRADNNIGFDTANTTIQVHVTCGKYSISYMHSLVCVYIPYIAMYYTYSFNVWDADTYWVLTGYICIDNWII